MHCVVTAGPTYEELDQVRRLTNLSTGRLGSELADFLTNRGHHVTLLVGAQASYGGRTQAQRVGIFTTTADLAQRLERLAQERVDAVFHAAAVSDFTFGKVWLRSAGGELTAIDAGKLPTRHGTLLAELVPTPKLIGRLRNWFRAARLIGWKYEVERDRSAAVGLGAQQLREYRTDLCVVNGPAYGEGFGIVQVDGTCVHVEDARRLFETLAHLVAA